MVMTFSNVFYCALFCVWIPFSLFALPLVDVTAEINQYEAFENSPLPGTVSVTHPVKEKIDATSFTMDGKPFKAEWIKDVNISDSSGLVISIFHFTLPPMKQGLQLLPSISVLVDGKRYASVSTGFEVRSGKSRQKGSAALTSQALSLKLEAFYHGTTPLYPGQLAWVGYRYFFSENISLSTENVPLLDAKGFKKIGGRIVNDREEGAYSVREIAQQVEAADPGVYHFGPSMIQGYANRKTAVSAQAETVTITVSPFPKLGKPAGFSGAVGQYTLDVKMLTPPDVRVGDKVELMITIAGTGDFASLRPPELCCLPGFSGRFQASDIPPVGQVEEGKVQFKTDVRPLSASITEIPPIEFSYYDPVALQYATISSSSIPLHVTAWPEKDAAAPLPKKQEKKATLPQPSPIEIVGNAPLTPADLENIPFGSWWSLVVIPGALSLILLQYNLRAFIKKTKKEKPRESSERLFAYVREAKEHNSDFYYLLNRSFFLLFKEKGILDDVDITPQRLPERPPFLEVREFLLDLEERRFGSALSPECTKEDIARYEELFTRIQHLTG